MDVAEFFSEFRRMCKATSDCTKCQYHGDMCDNAIELFEKTVAAVEKWSKEHPRKTRQSVFLEQYPEARFGADGCLNICPNVISPWHRNKDGYCIATIKCVDCRHKFWMQEAE